MRQIRANRIDAGKRGARARALAGCSWRKTSTHAATFSCALQGFPPVLGQLVSKSNNLPGIADLAGGQVAFVHQGREIRNGHAGAVEAAAQRSDVPTGKLPEQPAEGDGARAVGDFFEDIFLLFRHKFPFSPPGQYTLVGDPVGRGCLRSPGWHTALPRWRSASGRPHSPAGPPKGSRRSNSTGKASRSQARGRLHPALPQGG